MKQNPVDIYQEYLAWFKNLTQTPEGIKELRTRKAYGEWMDEKAPVVPYTFGLWLINDKNSGVDEEKLRKLVRARIQRNRYHIAEDFRHVDGNRNKPLLNPEYLARAEATKKLREQYKTYSGSDEIAKDVLFGLRKDHGDLLKVGRVSNPTTIPNRNMEYSNKPGWLRRLWDRLTGAPELKPRKSYAELQEEFKNDPR